MGNLKVSTTFEMDLNMSVHFWLLFFGTGEVVDIILLLAGQHSKDNEEDDSDGRFLDASLSPVRLVAPESALSTFANAKKDTIEEHVQQGHGLESVIEIELISGDVVRHDVI